MRHDPRQQRVQRRPLHRGERGGQRGDGVQRPHQRPGQHRVHQQDGAQQAQARLGAEDQPPLVQRVRERAAVESAHDQRNEFDGADRADGRRGAGELLELHGECDKGQEAAEVGDKPGQPHPAEVRGGAPGRQVRQQRPPARSGARRRRDGRRRWVLGPGRDRRRGGGRGGGGVVGHDGPCSGPGGRGTTELPPAPDPWGRARRVGA